MEDGYEDHVNEQNIIAQFEQMNSNNNSSPESNGVYLHSYKNSPESQMMISNVDNDEMEFGGGENLMDDNEELQSSVMVSFENT